MLINLKFSNLFKCYKWNTIWYAHIISNDIVTNKLELTCIIRIDGYRDNSKKIVKISVSIPDLDYSIDSDYNNYPWLLLEIEESVESFSHALLNPKRQVLQHSTSFSFFIRTNLVERIVN
jgi:hypothetical protein